MRGICLSALLLCLATVAGAQTPDTILLNGKILTLDGKSTIAPAVAITGGRVAAVGSSDDIRKLAGSATRVVDLRGRTVIPGLIDSHLHAIRAALSFSTEVNWIGARSLEEALGRIRAAARTMKPGSWLIVAGGWNVQQFEENRRPTQAELMAVAPNNPVYVQLGYGWSMLTPLAHKALGLSSEADLPPGGRFERDGNGVLTGAVTGAQNAIVALFDRLPKPTFAEQVEGIRRARRHLDDQLDQQVLPHRLAEHVMDQREVGGGHPVAHHGARHGQEEGLVLEAQWPDLVEPGQPGGLAEVRAQRGGAVVPDRGSGGLGSGDHVGHHVFHRIFHRCGRVGAGNGLAAICSRGVKGKCRRLSCGSSHSPPKRWAR